MPRTCTICGHSKRSAIEKALLSGEALRKIAERTGTSVTSLHRHKTEHLTPTLVKANGAAEAAHGDDLLAKLASIESEARGILKDAKTAKDLGAAGSPEPRQA